MWAVPTTTTGDTIPGDGMNADAIIMGAVPTAPVIIIADVITTEEPTVITALRPDGDGNPGRAEAWG